MRLSRRQATAAAVGSLAAIAAPAWAQSGEEAAVAGAVDALIRAMIAADKAQLEAVTAPELSYGHSNGQTENRQQFVDGVLSGNLVLKSATAHKPAQRVRWRTDEQEPGAFSLGPT